MELLHKDIISTGDMMTIKRTADPTEQNQILHFSLKQKCTEEAEQVLDEFRDLFIDETDAEKVVWDLLQEDIIDEGDLNIITGAKDRQLQNKIFHYCLKRKCTVEAFKIVCEIFTKVKGNPKMKALGKAMRKKLETGVCVCACVHACVCAFVGVCMLVISCVWCGVRYCSTPSRAIAASITLFTITFNQSITVSFLT